jgi:hypothetical protein
MLARNEGKEICQFEFNKNEKTISLVDHAGKWFQGFKNLHNLDGLCFELNPFDDSIDVSICQIQCGPLAFVTKLGSRAIRNSFLYSLDGLLEVEFDALKRMFPETDRDRLRLVKLINVSTKALDANVFRCIGDPNNFRLPTAQTRYKFELWDQNAILEHVKINDVVIKRLRECLLTKVKYFHN